MFTLNNIKNLILNNIKHNKISKISVFALNNYVKKTHKNNTLEITDFLYSQYNNDFLKCTLNQLTPDELDLINHLFFKDKTLKSYTDKKGICYSSAVKKKRYVLDKLFMHIIKYEK